MIRKYFNRDKPSADKIKWRNHEVTRIEAFSDAVFAFAVSLLVISLEVPKSSKELLESLLGLIPFIFCFIVIFWIWRSQYKFFRRYGLHDSVTLSLNGILLFFTLALVYPLKFLFGSMFLPATYIIRPEDFATLVMLYNGGFAIIGFLFFMMYLNASMQKETIRLTDVEVFETISAQWYYLFPAFISLTAVLIAYAERNREADKVSIAFLPYALLGIIMPLFGRYRSRQYKKKFGNLPVSVPEHNPE